MDIGVDNSEVQELPSFSNRRISGFIEMGTSISDNYHQVEIPPSAAVEMEPVQDQDPVIPTLTFSWTGKSYLTSSPASYSNNNNNTNFPDSFSSTISESTYSSINSSFVNSEQPSVPVSMNPSNAPIIFPQLGSSYNAYRHANLDESSANFNSVVSSTVNSTTATPRTDDVGKDNDTDDDNHYETNSNNDTANADTDTNNISLDTNDIASDGGVGPSTESTAVFQMEDERKKVIFEILSTEESYVQFLRLIKMVCSIILCSP